MQSTRWANNPKTSKVGLRKRAGSLSAEKLALAQQQLFYDDLSYNSSPRSHHIRTLLSPESLPSTEATLQNYNNSQYFNSQNHFRVDSKLSNLESTEKVYSNVASTPSKVAHNSGKEASTAASSRTVKSSKANQLANALDLEAIMPVEAKKLCYDLEQLVAEERKFAMIVDENTFSNKIQQEIDCVGCVSSLHTYLYQLSELAKNKPGSVLYFEGFVVYGDRRIGFSEEKIGDIHNIAYILHHHKSKNSIIDELTRSLNIKKKNDGHLHRGKVLSRCLLHSNKPMPNGIWREALQNLIEHDINEVASVAELDESVFISSLQAHTKRRKFCSTCKENIMVVYENMLEEASNCSDCEEGAEDDEEEDEEEEEYEETEEEGPLEVAPDLATKVSVVKDENTQKTGSNGATISDYGSMNEINESGDHIETEKHREQQQSRVISYTRKTCGSLLACIKYCPERRKIAIPLEMEIFMEFLSKAECGTTAHTKHANTKEAAQEELVACIGTCLKERLQSIWRAKKSEELARILFMKLAADCVVDRIRSTLEEKNYRLGHKTILEEYLNETEAAEQQKKEKLRLKRQKRKDKKRMLKQGGQKADGSDLGDEDGEDEGLDDENIEKGHKDNKKSDKEEIKKEVNSKGVSKNLEIKGEALKKDRGPTPPKEEPKTKESKGIKGQDNKVKEKDRATSIIDDKDKFSTNSNTPEANKSAEKNSNTKKGKNEVEEEKLEKKKKNEENIKSKKVDEREKKLLMAMGWTEDTSEVEGTLDEKDVRTIKDKWNEITALRANFRKSAKEQFMRLLYSK